MDRLSEVSWSGASETDQMIFSILSNENRVDTKRIPRIPLATTTEGLNEPRIEEVQSEKIPPVFINNDSIPLMDAERAVGEMYTPLDEDVAQSASHESPFPLSQPIESKEPFSNLSIEAPALPKPLEPPELQPSIPAPPPSPKHRVPQFQTSEDDELQKRTVLLDLQQLSMQNGVTLTKEWSMEDRLEDMLLEMRRHSLALDEKSNVNMMRDGMRLLISGMEMVNTKMGLLDLEGWSTEVCRDLNKHDADLARIYRKYWRRGSSNSPEASLALSIFGSMGMHHLKRTMSKNLMNRTQSSMHKGFAQKTSKYQEDDSSDDEGPPL